MTDVEIARKYLAKYDNARARKIPFSMSFAHFKRMMNRKTCFYTRAKLIDQHPQQHPTVDRKDPSLGYTDANTVVCTSVANNFKNNLSPAEIGLIHEKLEEHD